MIVVTGGAGFIGSHIVKALTKRKVSNILVVDKLGTGPKWKNLRDLRFADYMEAEDLPEFLRSNTRETITHIFHMGACSTTTEEDNSFLVRNNFEYSKMLAKYAFEKKAHFIYASSAATYGDGSQGFSDNERNLYKLCPLNMYGYSKHMFDLWLKSKGKLRNVVGLKYFNVFGPGEAHKGDMRSMVSKAFEQMKYWEKIKLFMFPHGVKSVRDFIYIDDAIDITMFFYNHPEIRGIYNVGSGKARSWDDLAQAVCWVLDKRKYIEPIDMPDELKDSYQYVTEADISKLRKAGYKKPMLELEQGVKKYFNAL